MSALNLLTVEMRRALHRRLVYVLVGLGVLGSTVAGVIAFVTSTGRSLAELRADGGHPAVMTDWWAAGGEGGVLLMAAIPLLVGGLLGGASVAGAEWRADSS